MEADKETCFMKNCIGCDVTPRNGSSAFYVWKLKRHGEFLMGRNYGMLLKIFEKSLDGIRCDAMRYEAISCDGSEIG